jgi:serine/threonine-protein kinase
MRLDQFAKVVVESRLATSEVVEQARQAVCRGDSAGLGSGPETDAAVRLARRLIDDGAITRYQARKLLAGFTRGFFLGGCRVLRPLGEGGMGKVYLAVREKDGQKVALKVLPPKKARESEQALNRFRREMDLSRRVVHPNLARTLDVGQTGDVHYMIMEYVPGDSLYHLVKEGGGPLRVPDAARYVLKVLDGLSAAHAAGLVHRDIKPSNLMITPDGDAKVLDLGLARAMGEENPLTRPNTVLGTLDYASPEQLSDASRADARSDLYSLGCTLYFMLRGEAPFEGGDAVNKIYKQRMEDPEPLEKVARGVPTAFAAIVRKLMAKDPADRHQTCEELRTDLARWTDPSRVRAILGAEADAARAFKPPPPELDDDDLMLLPDPDPSLAGRVSLRDLGEAEPGAAPLHRAPPPPRPAVVVRPPGGSGLHLEQMDDDDHDARWLVRFALIVGMLGIVAIVVITLLQT